MITISCKNCGRKKEVYPSRIRVGKGKFCSRHCANSYNNRGEKNYWYGRRGWQFGKKGDKSINWKGGRILSSGYQLVSRPDHPRANNHGYVKEEWLVMERHLGRPLKKGELVHHMNHIRNDNRVENLMVLGSKSEHGKFHGRPKGIPMHPNTRKSLEKLGRKFK